jgi:GNAT superfamily N-acetyltransferase
MSIRRVKPEDFRALVPLMKQFATTNENGLESRYEHILENPNHVLLVVEIDNEIVGYAAAQGYGKRLRSGEETVRLNDLMVLPEHRKHGVGRSLLEGIRTWCKARGARYLEWQSSSQSVGFYEKLGLKPQAPQLEYPFFEIDFEAKE